MSTEENIFEEHDVKLSVGINNYDDVYEKARHLVELLDEADGLAKEITTIISGTDFLNLF